ncbi:MAG TPA: T9SS type A sorting domain-containing protein, partial [Bacteroidales bacterium]|nr:T9SS type A sorting domain-containing protein [Bacteroidales bacterium]
DFDLTITDISGNVVFERHEFEAETEYYDTLYLDQGCYVMRLTDSENTGLSYWAWPEQGSGYFLMYDTEGSLMKSFQAEFGNQIHYAFSMGSALHIQEPNLSGQLEVSPNPTSGLIKARIAGAKGKTILSIIDAQGREILRKQFETNGEFYEFNADLSDHKPGLYLIQVNNKWVKASRKIILR